MRHEYRATISWAGSGEEFTGGKYSRAHRWKFDGGIELEASASPQVVPPPFSRDDAVDPEEAYVAAVSSCHMLTFLHLASREKINVTGYVDEAVGILEKGAQGKAWVSGITLNPHITYAGTGVSDEEARALHHAAHKECYIANSVRTKITVVQS